MPRWKVKYDPRIMKYIFINDQGEVHPNHAYNKQKHANDWCSWINYKEQSR